MHVQIDVFDGAAFARLAGSRAPSSSFVAKLPCYLAGPVDVSKDGAPFLRVTPVPPSAGARPLPVAVVNEIAKALPWHSYAAPCTDAKGLERRRTVARVALESVAIPSGPLAGWSGLDFVSPIVIGVAERLIGSFELPDEDVADLISALPGAPNGVRVRALIEHVRKQGGTWPQSHDAQTIDEEARQIEASMKASEAASARNAAEAVRIVEVRLSDEGIEGFRARVGLLPAFAHLINSKTAFQQDGWNYFLRRALPGELLPTITGADGSGTIAGDTQLRISTASATATADSLIIVPPAST